MKIAVAINSASGKGRAGHRRVHLAELLRAYPVQIDWLRTGTPELSEISMREAAQSGEYDALLVAGGDGIVHLAVNALRETGIPLGVIAMGSGNDIAREFDLPIHRPQESIAHVMSALLGGRHRLTDTMDIYHDGQSTRALAILSAGIDAEVNYHANAMAWPRGNMRYVRGIVRALKDFEPYGARLTIDGRTAEGSHTLISVANTRYFGGGFCIAPEARTDDGLLDVVVARRLSGTEFATIIPKLLARQHLKDSRVHLIRGKEITIEPNGQYLPKLMADGEEICTAPATIRIAPGSLALLR